MWYKIKRIMMRPNGAEKQVRPSISLKTYEEIVAMATAEQASQYSTTYPLTTEELNKYPEEYYNTFDSGWNLTQVTISYPNSWWYKRLSWISRSWTGYSNASVYYIDNTRQYWYKTSWFY